MANFYEYLVSSLPMLHFGMDLPFAFERFLQIARGLIPDEDFKVLEGISLDWQEPGIQHPTLAKWLEFDTALRNEIAKIRALRRRADAARYLRGGTSFSDPALTHLALASHRNPSLIEAERILDEARWYLLEELACGHYFDLEFLITYALKLRMLQRWDRINKADKQKLLSLALEGN